MVAAEAGAALLLPPAVLSILQTLASATEVRVVISLQQEAAFEARAAVARAAFITAEAEGSN